MSVMSTCRSIRHKSSIGCYLPTFVQVVGAEQHEVIRALPIHLFHVNREPRDFRCLRLSPAPENHAPRVSSPLRRAQAAIDTHSVRPVVDIEPLFLPKGVSSQPRVPSVIKDFCDGGLKPEQRRSAYTFNTFKERPQQPRKVAQSFKKNALARPVLANIEIVARAGEQEMQVIRTKLEGTKRAVAAMHKRLAELEEKREKLAKKRRESARVGV